MKENWYDLVYEKDERGERHCGPTVLYTSPQGLKALSDELQRMSRSNEPGRYQLEIPEMDEDLYAPFTHVEVANQPLPEEGSDQPKWYYPWICAGFILVPLFALYGVVRLVTDLF